MDQEKRRRTRVDVGDIKARITLHGREEEPVDVTLHDVSLKGLSCSAVEGFAVGEECRVTIIPGPGVEVSVEAVVVRCDESSAALEFKAMDPDSFYHLRRMVQLHSEDADTIDRELFKPAFD